MREINCENLHNHHVVITHAQPEVNFSSNRIGHVSCIKARGLRPRADNMRCVAQFAIFLLTPCHIHPVQPQ